MANGVWTNNWRALRNIMLMGRHVNGLSTLTNLSGTTIGNITNLNGGYTATGLSPMANYTYQNTGPTYDSSSRPRIVLGVGTAQPTAADYKMGEDVTNISYLSVNTTSGQDLTTGTITTNVTLSVQYTGSGSITIREWGIIGVMFYGSSGTLSSTHNVLLYHELLDTPVTLTTYQSANLNLSLSMTLEDPL